MSAQSNESAVLDHLLQDVMPLIHCYPARPGYRLSGAPEARVGDIAWCGHVKQIPGYTGFTVTDLECVVCAHRREANRP